MALERARPPLLPPGTPLGEHYTVEGLVRLAERRMFYIANDLRPDRPTRRCWTCGHHDTPRSAVACGSCHAPLAVRRFLISVRWRRELFDPWLAFVARNLRHPGLAPPVDVFVDQGVLFSVVPYGSEGLMVDEAAPLNNARLLQLALRIVGTVAYLHRHGVRLAALTRANLLVSPDGTIRLYDLEVEETLPVGASIPPEQQGAVMQSVGELLRRYCDIEADSLIDFLLAAEEGGSLDMPEFGRELEGRYETWATVSYGPVLGGMSDVGLTRALNEDNWRWIRLSDRAKLYAVADGMGGHAAGELASAIAVKKLCEVARERAALGPEGEEALENLLDESFRTANNTVKDEADARGIDMGTTLVCMLVVDNHIGFIANVGDSRGYLMRNGVLHQVTQDHSLVQKMVQKGRLTAEQAIDDPRNNILLRTVGTERDIDVDIFRVELEPGDRVLMCSDGLWGEVRDRELESILNTYSDPRIASRELVRAAHQGGGKDNVTLMIVGM